MDRSALSRLFHSRATGAADRLMPWLLAGFAVVYYSLYVRAGLNLGGEGGTAGVVALRLLDGQRPFVDTFLGYNVLWFFPVAGLFEITGPSYLALRWYFFAFCTASGLLVYFVVHGHTRNPWYSAVPAVMAILVPGMIFRNYMPFLGILNAFLLTRAFVIPRKSSRRSLAWMAAAGAGLGLTFLFRIDLGVFCTVIFLGLAVLYPLGEPGARRRAGLAAAGAAAGLALAWALHLPVWADAKARGYDRAFLEQYTGWITMIAAEFRRQMSDLAENDTPPAVAPPAADPAASTTPIPAASPALEVNSWEDRGALARVPLSDAIFGRKWIQKAFAISTYLPILISVIAVLTGGIALLAALVRRDPVTKERMLYPLTVLGCALALLPQFLFFRPDTPHLSEMMVPFLAALALIVWECGRAAVACFLPTVPAGSDTGEPARRRGLRMLGGGALADFAALCIAAAAIYLSLGLAKESAGSIAAKKSVKTEFRALNGVDVLVRERDVAWLGGLRDAVLRHASPGEFVLCLPYSPTINFMTDRPSPLHNLYVDNATAGGGFAADFLALMTGKRPPVVVVDERRINRNDQSRFSNWAPGPYRWLHENYVYFGRYARNEVFVRPDRAPAPVTPEAISVSD
jgi:hypothetical protein